MLLDLEENYGYSAYKTVYIFSRILLSVDKDKISKSKKLVYKFVASQQTKNQYQDIVIAPLEARPDMQSLKQNFRGQLVNQSINQSSRY